MKFYRGLRTDTAHIDQPQDSYRRARNIILDHTTMSVRTEGALDNLAFADEDYNLGQDTNENNLCGLIPLPQDRQLAIIEDATDGEHDLVLVTEDSYALLATFSSYGWSPDYPIQGVAYENAAGETIVVWTDGQNRPVYTNLDASTIVIYDLFPEAEFPNVISLPSAWDKSGTLDNGTYSFFIAYEVDRDNLTPFSPSYGAYKIGHGISDKQVKTTIGLKFDGLDTRYDMFRIYVIHERNGVRNAYYLNRQSTSQYEYRWRGEIRDRNISLDQLTIPPGWYTNVETMTALDDRLYVAGLQRNDGFDGQSIADGIDLYWTIDGSCRYNGAPKYDHAWDKQWGLAFGSFEINQLDDQRLISSYDHYGMSMGFMPECAYAFYIAFLLKDGTWTEGYPISAGVSNAAATSDPVQNLTTLLDSSIKLFGQLGSQNNGNGTYLHTMPSVSQLHTAWSQVNAANGADANDWAAVNIGIAGRNVIIPSDVQELIQGYSFFYAKPNANTRNVLAYSSLLESGGAAVSHDVYLENTKPQLQSGELTCVYSGNNGYYTPVVNSTTYTVDGFEYLPGNAKGVDNDNDDRENRLYLNTATTFNDGQGVDASVFGQGEGSEYKFGTVLNQKWTGYPAVTQAGSAFENQYWKIGQTPVDWYDNLDQQDLVACSHIEKSIGQSTQRRVSFGGDCLITPNRFRRMSNAASQTTNGIGTGVVVEAYFTYSYAMQELEDLSDPTVLTKDKAQEYAIEPALNYAGSPEIMNPASIPGHVYKKNTDKSAFPTSDEDPIYRFPNRIARSAKQNYESNAVRWSTFAVADYYDNALNKGPITNLTAYAGELIIHHTDGIFKTLGKETLDTSASAVFVGSGDIFRAPPQELLPTEEGYAGLKKHTDAQLTKAGYVFVDAEAGKVFKLDSQLSDISAQGMRRYFRERFRVDTDASYSPYANNGYAIGYDPVFDRILITALQGADAFQTISFSQLHGCWASNHTYPMLAYGTNRTSVVGWTGARFSTINVGDNRAGAYIEPVFNQGGSTPKLFQSFQWVTRATEGEGDWNTETFDRAIVYNDRGCSGERNLVDNVRWVEEAWNFNDFRNLVPDANIGDSFFDDEDELIATIDINKPWYTQQRIRGGYAAIRLIVLPSAGRTLYLSEALARFRESFR
jgi:hypothetical protein